MKNQILQSSSREPNSKTDKAKTRPDNAELSEESLSQIIGGTGANLGKACATGKHIPEVKL
jgi:bacteriocin-like protein